MTDIYAVTEKYITGDTPEDRIENSKRFIAELGAIGILGNTTAINKSIDGTAILAKSEYKLYKGFKVTPNGRMFGVNDKELSMIIDKNSGNIYYSINAAGNKETIYIARVVYKLFVDENFEIDDRNQVIQYKDGDKMNVSPENLYTTTMAEVDGFGGNVKKRKT